jgi:CubicO group peptidase (beta-lactamase class C family)
MNSFPADSFWRQLLRVLWFGPILVASTAALADQVDDFVLAQMAKQHTPAVSIAVMKNGKVVKTKGYGFANLELDIRATPETVYQIGSVSKQFIAAAVMLLNREGKVGLDDSIRKYIGDAPEAWQPITLRHLLTHTSGLIRDTIDLELKEHPDIEVISAAYPIALLFKPGEKLSYSNVGYFALAEIIARTSGKPWPQFIDERIFTPLGMKSTRTTTNDDLIAHRASGYQWADGRYQNALVFSGVRPSGAFLSTVQDMARWDAALYSNAVLTEQERSLMWTPVKLNNGTPQSYGFGWEVSKVGEHRLVHHAGTMLGFRADISRYVDDGVTVVALTNAFGALPEKIAGGVAALYIPGLQPKRHAVKMSDVALDAFTGKYQLAQGVLTVSREAGQLVMDVAVGPGTIRMGMLTPEGTGKFFDEDNPRSTYSFEPDAQGRLNFVMRAENGKEGVRGARLPPAP